MLSGNRRKRGGQSGNGMMRGNQMQRKNFQPQQNMNFNAINQLNDFNDGYMDFNEPQQPQQRQQNMNKRKNPQQNQSAPQQQKRMRKNFQNGNAAGGGGQNKNWNQNRRMNQPNNNFQPPQFNPPQMMNQRMPMRNNNQMPPQFQGCPGPMGPMRGGPNMPPMMMRGGPLRRPTFQPNTGKFPPNPNQTRKNPNQLNKVTKAKTRVLGNNKPQPLAGAKKPVNNKNKKKQRDPYSLEAPFVTDEIKAEHAKKEEIMESMKGKGKNDELFNKFKEQREIFVKKYDEAKAAYLAEKKVGHG